MLKLPNNIWINTRLAAGMAACIFLLFPMGHNGDVALSPHILMASFIVGIIVALAALMAAGFVIPSIVLRWRQ